jgi:hypothetical protein
VARIFIAFGCVPFWGHFFGTVVKSFETKLRLPFNPQWSPFPVLQDNTKLILFLDGCGKQFANQNTRSSFGCS